METHASCILEICFDEKIFRNPGGEGSAQSSSSRALSYACCKVGDGSGGCFGDLGLEALPV